MVIVTPQGLIHFFNANNEYLDYDEYLEMYGVSEPSGKSSESIEDYEDLFGEKAPIGREEFDELEDGTNVWYIYAGETGDKIGSDDIIKLTREVETALSRGFEIFTWSNRYNVLITGIKSDKVKVYLPPLSR